MEPDSVLDGRAWRELCERVQAAGDRILADDFPGDDLDRAEGVRHLATQLACWLTFATGHTDVHRPSFFRSADPIFRWGGANVDQVARRAAVAGDGAYRVAGRMGSCEEFVLQVKVGATQSGGAGVATEVFASQLGLAPGDEFELFLGGPERDGHWFPLDPEASFVHVRDYYFDWQPAEPATFVIERLDALGTPTPRVDAAGVARMLDLAAHEVEHSITFWRDYQQRMLDERGRNAFNDPRPEGRGVQDILYSHAIVALGADEAMVLELDAGGAAMWDVGLYNRGWYEPLDYADRTTSLNHRQVHASPGGTTTVVVAGRDPGVANWLDTEGRGEVLATVRWFRPTGAPTIRHRTVPAASLAGELPVDLPRVDGAARRRERADRTAHVAWRFRT
jgi:hypothetical protein